MERRGKDPDGDDRPNAESGETFGCEKPPPCECRRPWKVTVYGCEDMLRRQRREVLAGVTNAEPTQKTLRAQENALAGLRLKAAHLAQIVRKGAQK